MINFSSQVLAFMPSFSAFFLLLGARDLVKVQFFSSFNRN